MSLYLDWTHNGLDSLNHLAPDDNINGVQCRRLRKELPVLPFLSLDFTPDLFTQLDSLQFIKKYKHLLILGIGGSALGPRALQKAFFSEQDLPNYSGPYIWVMDNIDALQFSATLGRLEPEQTLVVVISKSGGTVETMSQYFIVRQWLSARYPDSWQQHFVMITDSEKGFLRDEVRLHGICSLDVPFHLGGRFSVLSAVGLLPALFMGIDYRQLVAGALEVSKSLVNNPDLLPGHPAYLLASWATRLMGQAKNELIFFSYVPQLNLWGDWFAQLWAESLGKGGNGSMPLPAVGVTDQHSLLQMFLDGPQNKACLFLTTHMDTSLTIPGNLSQQWAWLADKPLADILRAEAEATRMSLVRRGMPLLNLHFDTVNEFTVGKMIMLLEAATMFAGWLLDINPLDQPAVEEGKILAKARLGAQGYDLERDAMRNFLNQALESTNL